MKDDVAEMVREIYKLDPKEGDVIAVKVPQHWDRTELWDVIGQIREKGIQIVAFTDDVTLSVIKDTCSYLLQIPMSLPQESVEKIKEEWRSNFPNAPIMVVSGTAGLIESPKPEEPEGLDTL